MFTHSASSNTVHTYIHLIIKQHSASFIREQHQIIFFFQLYYSFSSWFISVIEKHLFISILKGIKDLIMAAVPVSFFQQCIQSKGIRWISFGWMGFITENVVLSENRTAIIEAFGDDNYHRLYNTLSTAATGSIAFGFFRHGRKMGPLLTERGTVSKLIGYSLQSAGLIGLSQLLPKFQIPVESSQVLEEISQGNNESVTPSSSAFSLRCPMDFRAKDIPADGIYGMDRISRHATFWSFGFLSLGAAATTGKYRSLYTYIYIYICTYMYIHIYMYKYTCIHIYTYLKHV
jgi:hypothetical protein